MLILCSPWLTLWRILSYLERTNRIVNDCHAEFRLPGSTETNLLIEDSWSLKRGQGTVSITWVTLYLFEGFIENNTFSEIFIRLAARVCTCGCVWVCVGVRVCGCMSCWIVGDVILWFWFGSCRSAGTSYCPFLLSFVRVQRRSAVPCSAPREIYLQSVVLVVIVVDGVVVFPVSPLTAVREKQ